MAARIDASVLSLLALLATGCVAPSVATPVRGPVTIRIGMYPSGLLSRVDPVPRESQAREGRLHELFSEVGCQELEEQGSGPSAVPSVVCTLAGESQETIVVGANLQKPAIPGRVPDDWVAAVMLPSLFESLRAAPRRHTFLFVGLADARRATSTRTPASFHRFMRRMPRRERDDVVAVVSLEGFTTNPLRARASDADPNLSLDLYSVSRSLELPFGQVRKANLADVLNRRYRIPSIKILISDIQVGEYLDSYRMVAVYLGYLDRTLDVRRRMARN